MKLNEFDYELPKELIAQHPIKKRDESRLMIVDRNSKKIENKIFKDIINYFEKGDCIVRNITKVMPARLYGIKKETNAKVEFLLLKQLDKDVWEVMVKPGKKALPGMEFVFGNNKLQATVIEILEGGNRKIKFEYAGIFNEILDEIGLMPLPPYITEKLIEKERYQTIYAENIGSAAAPTAGLHFTEELIDKLIDKGIKIVDVTLHVGIGTFRPVKVENIEEHKMHSEFFYISKQTADIINETKKNKHKVIAVGTTSCRVLESATNDYGIVEEKQGETSIFIYPGYTFKCIDGLITNFHLPESSLIMLVSALAGKDFIMQAYKNAVEEKYRFFSFGDAMLII